jgi:transglutaminase-like putative cysteine protease
MLFADAVRSLGFGARIVSAYLYNPDQQSVGRSTHAWAEVFVPGAGWIIFDRTSSAEISTTVTSVQQCRARIQH